MFAYLNLPISLETHAAILAQAGKDNVSHEEFLKRLLSVEAAAKFERQVDARLAAPGSPRSKNLGVL